MSNTYKKNKLAQLITKIEKAPKFLHVFLRSKLFGTVVKFFGTAGIQVLEMNPQRAVMVMKNRKKVQNHIGTVHAAAMSLLAESCTGMLMGMSLPDSKLPLMKSMSFKYVKRAAKGELKAVAELTDEQIQSIHEDDKGEVQVKVTITDINGVEPVLCDMVWAWIPKK